METATDNKEPTQVVEEIKTTETTTTVVEENKEEKPKVVEETKTTTETTTTTTNEPAPTTEPAQAPAPTTTEPAPTQAPAQAPAPTTTTTTTTTTAPVNKTTSGKKVVRDIPLPSTVMEALSYTTNKLPNQLAMRVERNGSWKKWTWQQYRNDVISAAKSIVSLGVHSRAGVNVIGFNSPEWHIAYLGAIHSNALPTGVYTTSSPSQCEYFATHSDAQLVFVEDIIQLNKYLSVRDKLPNVKAIVIMETAKPTSNTTTTTNNGKESTNVSADSTETPLSMATKYPNYVYTWEQFMELGRSIPDSEVENHSKNINPSDLATLIYTSGTTSLPKGVMLTHCNILWTVHTIGYDVVNEAAPQTERIISYLPLSHIAEQIVSLYAPIVFGFPVAFAQKTALSGTLLDTLQEVRPTIFFGVPRVWEKIQVKIQSLLSQNGGLKKKLVNWAQKKGVEGGYKEQKGEKKPRGYGLAKTLVFKKAIKNLGLDQCKLLASAAAPISIDTLEFFLGLGITVCEAYGMSELSGPQSVGYPKTKAGSVGTTMKGSEVRIGDDGEILVKGPNCFVGYYKNEEASRETIDSEGWVHTGDVGHIDSDGFIYITDRKKELIITAGGENIAPTLIEGYIRQIIGVEQAVVIGDRQKYLVALITVNPDLFKLLPAQGYTHPLPKTMEEAMNDKEFNNYINNHINEINSKLPNVSTIKKFKILPVEFQETGETSELTPTKKLKRRIITNKYEKEIKELYGDQYAEGGFSSATPAPSTSIPTNKPTQTPDSVPVIVKENEPSNTTTTATVVPVTVVTEQESKPKGEEKSSSSTTTDETTKTTVEMVPVNIVENAPEATTTTTTNTATDGKDGNETIVEAVQVNLVQSSERSTAAAISTTAAPEETNDAPKLKEDTDNNNHNNNENKVNDSNYSSSVSDTTTSDSSDSENNKDVEEDDSDESSSTTTSSLTPSTTSEDDTNTTPSNTDQVKEETVN